jgi:hypothetical protein
MTERDVRLGTIQETLLIPLYGRAVENRKEKAVLRDPVAEELVAAIDYDFARFDGLPMLLGTVLRTSLFDRWVADFLAEHPTGTVVEIGTGLNTLPHCLKGMGHPHRTSRQRSGPLVRPRPALRDRAAPRLLHRHTTPHDDRRVTPPAPATSTHRASTTRWARSTPGTGTPGQGESYTDILVRHGLEELSADGRSTPPQPDGAGMATAGAFGAKFVEVRIDPDLGLLRVARVVSAIDGGRILNAKTATSQIIGGTVGGIGQALFEDTATDEGTGRIANATFGDDLMPVNADVPDMDVLFVGEPDRATPVGTKGVGEIGLVGIAAAIANAVHHATGRRIRSLPITIDRLL